MADTTTTHLHLVKMGAGTHRDDWGDVANANLDAIDAGVKAASDAAAAALPKEGGAMANPPTVTGEGVFPHFAASGMTKGRIYLSPAAGTDPTSQAGDIWLGY